MVLVNKVYQLQKFAGKGGWTYAAIDEVLPSKTNPFGWVTVCGSIDGVEISNYKLMPMGNGKLFLPVNANMRKKIGKQAGDWVNVVLCEDKSYSAIPDELLLCLKDEPRAYKTFLRYSANEQKAVIKWIYASKKEEIRIDRMAEIINRLVHDFNATK